MEAIRCRSCGSTDITRFHNHYVCAYCRTSYEDQDEQKLIELTNKMIILFDDRRYEEAHALCVDILAKKSDSALAQYYRTLCYSTFDSEIYLEDDVAALRKALRASHEQVGNSVSYFHFAVNQVRAFMNMVEAVLEKSAARQPAANMVLAPQYTGKSDDESLAADSDISTGIATGAAIATGSALAADVAISVITGSKILGKVGGVAAGAVGGLVGGVVGGTVDAVSKVRKANKTGKSRKASEQPQYFQTTAAPSSQLSTQQADRIVTCLIKALYAMLEPVTDMNNAYMLFFDVQSEMVNLAERVNGKYNGSHNNNTTIYNARVYVNCCRDSFVQAKGLAR